MSKRPYTESEFDSNEYGFATKAIHVAQEPEKWDSRCVIPPIVLSSTFKQTSPGEYTFDYGRSGNPTRNTLEGCLAPLEKAKYALCFSSGLGNNYPIVIVVSFHGKKVKILIIFPVFRCNDCLELFARKG
jgi:cystathionine gamma-lyase